MSVFKRKGERELGEKKVLRERMTKNENLGFMNKICRIQDKVLDEIEIKSVERREFDRKALGRNFLRNKYREYDMKVQKDARSIRRYDRENDEVRGIRGGRYCDLREGKEVRSLKDYTGEFDEAREIRSERDYDYREEKDGRNIKGHERECDLRERKEFRNPKECERNCNDPRQIFTGLGCDYKEFRSLKERDSNDQRELRSLRMTNELGIESRNLSNFDTATGLSKSKSHEMLKKSEDVRKEFDAKESEILDCVNKEVCNDETDRKDEEREIQGIESILLKVAKKRREDYEAENGIKMADNNRLNKLREEYFVNKSVFERNKDYMPKDLQLINKIILSFEKRVYFDEEQKSRSQSNFSDEGYYGITNKEALKYKEIGYGSMNSQIFEGNARNFLFAPTICNSAHNEMKSYKDKSKSVDWAQVISESEDKENDRFKFPNGDKREKYRPYRCDEPGCDKSYTSLYGLKYHKDHGHSKIEDDSAKPFKCEATGCSKRYKNANGLKYHMENGHKF